MRDNSSKVGVTTETYDTRVVAMILNFFFKLKLWLILIESMLWRTGMVELDNKTIRIDMSDIPDLSDEKVRPGVLEKSLDRLLKKKIRVLRQIGDDSDQTFKWIVA